MEEGTELLHRLKAHLEQVRQQHSLAHGRIVAELWRQDGQLHEHCWSLQTRSRLPGATTSTTAHKAADTGLTGIVNIWRTPRHAGVGVRCGMASHAAMTWLFI